MYLFIQLLAGYIGVNTVVTAIFFAVCLLIRRRDLGTDGVSIKSLRADAFWFGLFAVIGVIAGTPIVAMLAGALCWFGGIHLIQSINLQGA